MLNFNKISYYLTIKLSFLNLNFILNLANDINVKSFTMKENINISKDRYKFVTKFRVINRLNFLIILEIKFIKLK